MWIATVNATKVTTATKLQRPQRVQFLLPVQVLLFDGEDLEDWSCQSKPKWATKIVRSMKSWIAFRMMRELWSYRGELLSMQHLVGPSKSRKEATKEHKTKKPNSPTEIDTDCNENRFTRDSAKIVLKYISLTLGSCKDKWCLENENFSSRSVWLSQTTTYGTNLKHPNKYKA